MNLKQAEKDLNTLLDATEVLFEFMEDFDFEKVTKYFTDPVRVRELQALARRNGRHELAEKISEEAFNDFHRKSIKKLPSLLKKIGLKDILG